MMSPLHAELPLCRLCNLCLEVCPYYIQLPAHLFMAAIMMQNASKARKAHRPHTFDYFIHEHTLFT
jgi:ferredoxin